MDTNQLIDRAVKGWEIAIHALEEKRARFESEHLKRLAEIDLEIADATRERDAIARQKYRLNGAAASSSRKGKAEKYRIAIIEYLTKRSEGATQSDVAKDCSIPISTVGRILKRNGAVFGKSPDDLWFITDAVNLASEIKSSEKYETEGEILF